MAVRSAILGLLAAVLLSGLPARAQTDYPSRVVRLIVPFPAGSATDSTARVLAEKMREELGQNFIVENKPGADGIIAAQSVATAPPDGYTLFVTTNTTHSANPSIYRKLPYDPVADFTPVGGILQIPFLLAVLPSFPADDVATFLKVARERKPPLTFGTGNTGSQASGELLKARTGIDMLQVAYRGSPQALTDLLGGRIDVFFPDPASGQGFIAAKQIKILAVTGERRLKTLPDVPTMEEAGVPNYRIVAWVGMFGPAKLPPEIVAKLNAALNKAIADPGVAAFMASIGSEPFPTDPTGLAGFVKEDAARWVEIVDKGHIERK